MSEGERKNNGLNVHEKVYYILLNLETDKIRPYELYYLIENMKFKRDEILDMITETLELAGFSEDHISRISNNLSWKLRFTRKDARKIEKELCKRGLICREKNYIYIKQEKDN
jgi:hypothetical protein